MSIQTATTDSRPRHPEKAHKPDNLIQPKPAWIRVKAPTSATYHETLKIIRKNNLRTVCEEVACPNIGERWSKKHATKRWLGKSGQGDEWIACLMTAMMAVNRRDDEQATTQEPQPWGMSRSLLNFKRATLRD